MIDRNKFNDSIAVISSVASAHAGINDFKQSVDKLTGTRDCFDVKVMFIGRFNAGKSALINALLGRQDFLKEEDAPETAIATELKYGAEETYYAFLSNGVCKKITKHRDFKPEDCDHVEYYIPSPNLKLLGDYTIVDTPGIDSGIDGHEKALTAYVGKGSAYILVVDITDGTISQNTLNRLAELTNYSSRLGLVLNKADLKTENECDKIRQTVEATLSANGLDCPLTVTSKFDGELAKKLTEIISHFQAQEAFDEHLKKALLLGSISIRNVLKAVQSSIYLDTFDVDKDILKLKESQQYLKDSFANQRKQFEENSSSITMGIVNNIRAELLSKADVVADALISGGQCGLSAIITETVRPVIIASMKDLTTNELDEAVHNIDFSGCLSAPVSKSLEDVLVQSAQNIKGMIENGTFTKAMESLLQQDENEKKDDDGVNKKQLYQIVTGIVAITTDVIAPWLEVVIILLPNIIALCKSLFGRNEHDRLKEIFVNNIIPQITQKLFDPLDKAVRTSQKNLLEHLEALMSEKLNAVEAALRQAQARRDGQIQNFEDQKQQLISEIASLEKLEEELKN